MEAIKTFDALPLDEACEWLQETVASVLNVMFGMEATLAKTIEVAPVSETMLAGSVGFAGKANGVVCIYLSDPLAREMTQRMLMLRDDEIESDQIVDDVVSEFGNMIAGGVKSRLCDLGSICVLTLPTTVRGKSFSIQGARPAESRELGFKCGDYSFIVQLMARM